MSSKWNGVMKMEAVDRPELVLDAAGRISGRTNEFRLDVVARELRGRSDTVIPLTESEFLILRELFLSPRAVVGRERLVAALHGSLSEGVGRSVDIHVSRLRRKMRQAEMTISIRTRRGMGYLIDPQ